MDSVFLELKRAREARNLSINDVADGTLINVQFLQAIEQGNTDILPQTYVRAFIREYASFVGLDPVQIMALYDRVKSAPAPPASEAPPPPTAPPAAKTEVPKDSPKPEKPQTMNPAIAEFALPGALVLVVAIVIWNLAQPKTTPEIQERPIENASLASDTGRDSTTSQLPDLSQQAALTAQDSMILRATVNDTVWVEMIIDDLEPQQYMFKPNRRIAWKARERFRISTGKPEAIEFTLNEQPVGASGKGGSASRSLEFNRHTLLQK